MTKVKTLYFGFIMFLTCWLNKQHIGLHSVSWRIFIFSNIIIFFGYIYETLSSVTVKQWTLAWRLLSQTYVKTIKTAILQSLFLRILFLSISVFLHPISQLPHSQFSCYPLLHYLSLTPRPSVSLPSTLPHTKRIIYSDGVLNERKERPACDRF